MDNNSPLCPDWVFLNNANVHVAKDRGWFKTYTPFTSKVDGSPFFSPPHHLAVLGIGTVEIPTKRSPNTSGVASHSSLLLHNVLHVPDCLCNFIGQPIMSDGYNFTLRSGAKSQGTIKDSKGKNVAYFDPKRPLCTIKIRSPPNGPPLGPYVLKEDELYMLGCRWEDAERRKWQLFQANNGLSTSGQNPASYTAEETAFLKKNYGSEFHFLTQHGLNIHIQQDRDEGRAILRAVMRDAELSDEEEEESDDESAWQGHQAD
ncbi:hypothetical protein IAQ61_008315 [Plenodomus lingam]|nr:hypothetical protein IAQ61_008315 [Plenodomus lingam]